MTRYGGGVTVPRGSPATTTACKSCGFEYVGSTINAQFQRDREKVERPTDDVPVLMRTRSRVPSLTLRPRAAVAACR